MRQNMIVTDITRMQGNRICVGGYLEDGTSIRPVTGRDGPTEAWLEPALNEHVVPFSLVELFVGVPPRLVRPHTEDRIVPVSGHRVVELLPNSDCLHLLVRSTSPGVRAIFGAEVHSAPEPDQPWGRYVQSGEGEHSLGTIQPNRIVAVQYLHRSERNRWDYRLRFVDEMGETFQLAVVDLAFRRRLDGLRDTGQSLEQSAREMLAELQRQTVYLRIGLARGWDRHPDRCYLQITGVYGFG